MNGTIVYRNLHFGPSGYICGNGIPAKIGRCLRCFKDHFQMCFHTLWHVPFFPTGKKVSPSGIVYFNSFQYKKWHLQQTHSLREVAGATWHKVLFNEKQVSFYWNVTYIFIALGQSIQTNVLPIIAEEIKWYWNI